MKPKYRLFNRRGRFYKRDTETGQRTSLKTSCRKAAQKIVDAENQAHESPALGQELAKAYLSTSDPMAKSRTWQEVMDEYARKGASATQERKGRVFDMSEFDPIRKKLVIGTVAEDFFAVLRSDKVTVNRYLIQLQNFAVDVGWAPRPIIPRRAFPKPAKKIVMRAITREEHERILVAEQDDERWLYYSLLWEIGASQSDAAKLTAEHFNLEKGILMYERSKTGQLCRMEISDKVREILENLPSRGLLFPGLQNGGHNFRASEFRRRCRLLGIKGLSLHSYRYSWAERAAEAGIPERFAMAALGHGSKMVHRAYARASQAVCPPLPG
ncbi:MAG: tyrosine-type recombinase/integrase [Verrucomicrobiales bacterium]